MSATIAYLIVASAAVVLAVLADRLAHRVADTRAEGRHLDAAHVAPTVSADVLRWATPDVTAVVQEASGLAVNRATTTATRHDRAA